MLEERNSKMRRPISPSFKNMQMRRVPEAVCAVSAIQRLHWAQIRDLGTFQQRNAPPHVHQHIKKEKIKAGRGLAWTFTEGHTGRTGFYRDIFICGGANRPKSNLLLNLVERGLV